MLDHAHPDASKKAAIKTWFFNTQKHYLEECYLDCSILSIFPLERRHTQLYIDHIFLKLKTRFIKNVDTYIPHKLSVKLLDLLEDNIRRFILSVLEIKADKVRKQHLEDNLLFHIENFGKEYITFRKDRLIKITQLFKADLTWKNYENKFNFGTRPCSILLRLFCYSTALTLAIFVISATLSNLDFPYALPMLLVSGTAFLFIFGEFMWNTQLVFAALRSRARMKTELRDKKQYTKNEIENRLQREIDFYFSKNEHKIDNFLERAILHAPPVAVVRDQKAEMHSDDTDRLYVAKIKRRSIETPASDSPVTSSKTEIDPNLIKFTGRWALPGRVDISPEAIRSVFPSKKIDEKLIQHFHLVAKRSDGKVMESTGHGREGFKRCNRLINWQPCFVKLKVFSTKEIPQAGNCRLYFASQDSKSNELTVPHYIDFKAHTLKSRL